MSPRALPALVIRVLAAGMLVLTAAGFLYIGTLTFQHWLRPPTQRLWAEAEVLRAQANRAWDEGEEHTARTLLTEAKQQARRIELPYHRVTILIQIARLFLDHGDRDEGLSTLAEAEAVIDEAPTSDAGQYRTMLTLAVARAGEADYLRNLIDRTMPDSGSRHLLGKAIAELAASGHIQEALNLTERVPPGFHVTGYSRSDVFYSIASVQLEAGDVEGSQATLRRVSEQAPPPSAPIRQAFLAARLSGELQRGAPQSAEQIFAEIRRLESGSLLVAKSAYALGNYEEAAMALNAALHGSVRNSDLDTVEASAAFAPTAALQEVVLRACEASEYPYLRVKSLITAAEAASRNSRRAWAKELVQAAARVSWTNASPDEQAWGRAFLAYGYALLGQQEAADRVLQTVKGSRPSRESLLMIGCLIAGAGVLGSWYLLHLKRWARWVVTISAMLAVCVLTIVLLLPRNVFSPTADWQEALLIMAMVWLVVTCVCLRVPTFKRAFE